jgi:conserved domain protein|nr:MAG TPA: Sporulation protein Cse60 [Caudoviricetes sp.]
MKIKLFEYARRRVKEDFEKEINDFMATVEVLDVKISGTQFSEPFGSVAIVLVLYR